MWHGGAHHVGFNVHDEIETYDGTRTLEPGMVFCIDVGIYHEEWGIDFRLEDMFDVYRKIKVTLISTENIN